MYLLTNLRGLNQMIFLSLLHRRFLNCNWIWERKMLVGNSTCILRVVLSKNRNHHHLHHHHVTHIYIYIYTHTRTHTHTHIYIYTGTHTYIYTHIHTHIHTHIYIYIHTSSSSTSCHAASTDLLDPLLPPVSIAHRSR